VKFGETLRRLIASVDGNALSLNIVMLKEKIRRLLSFGSNVVFTMTYADEDGDMVILATEDDLRDILPQSLNPLRITVN
ncbi:protein NBR1, partial [Tanacetum coccineum]